MRRNEYLDVNRDDLAAIIKLRFDQFLLQTGDWRPLADYVMDLLDLQANKMHNRTGEFDGLLRSDEQK
jgi:hypothetical protein